MKANGSIEGVAEKATPRRVASGRHNRGGGLSRIVVSQAPWCRRWHSGTVCDRVCCRRGGARTTRHVRRSR